MRAVGGLRLRGLRGRALLDYGGVRPEADLDGRMGVRLQVLRHREPHEAGPRAEARRRGERSDLLIDGSGPRAYGAHRGQYQPADGHDRLEGRRSSLDGEPHSRLRGNLLRRGALDAGRCREDGVLDGRHDGEPLPLRIRRRGGAGLRQRPRVAGAGLRRQRQVLHALVSHRFDAQHRPGGVRLQPAATAQPPVVCGAEHTAGHRRTLRAGCLLGYLSAAYRHAFERPQRAAYGRRR